MPLAYRSETQSAIRLANIHQWGKVEMPLDASFARIASEREKFGEPAIVCDSLS
jgi:hypothetical protein